MNTQTISASVLALAMLLHPAIAADDDALARMALCKDSWVDWSKSEPAKMKAFVEHFQTEFVPHDNDPYALPKTDVSVIGLHVSKAFWESIGMAVGFSVGVDATFEDARKTIEKELGKPLQKCESGDNMRECELELAPQRTVMLMSEDKPGSKHTLTGCYYFYEK